MDPNTPIKKQRSPLFYVVLGCGGLLGLITVGFIAVGLMAWNVAKDLGEGLTNPSAKAANIQKMMGTAPPGYYPVMTFSIPLVMEMALLGDKPQPEDGGPGDFDRGFMYFRVIANEQSNKARDFFDGKSADSESLRASGMNVDTKDILKRGSTKTSSGTVVKYVATRGTMETQGGRRGESRPGINTLMYFECPGDSAVRMGVWTMKDPNPELEAEKVNLVGTVADANELTAFLAPLTPCGK